MDVHVLKKCCHCSLRREGKADYPTRQQYLVFGQWLNAMNFLCAPLMPLPQLADAVAALSPASFGRVPPTFSDVFETPSQVFITYILRSENNPSPPNRFDRPALSSNRLLRGVLVASLDCVRHHPWAGVMLLPAIERRYTYNPGSSRALREVQVACLVN